MDVFVGDIGVGVCEISYMFGQYKCFENCFSGIFIGKSLLFGGSFVCIEVIGYGVVYFVQEMFEYMGEGFDGKIVFVLGFGNVVFYCMEKFVEFGVVLIMVLDLSGFVYDLDGICGEKFEWFKDFKENCCGCILEYVEYFGCDFYVNG